MSKRVEEAPCDTTPLPLKIIEAFALTAAEIKPGDENHGAVLVIIRLISRVISFFPHE